MLILFLILGVTVPVITLMLTIGLIIYTRLMKDRDLAFDRFMNLFVGLHGVTLFVACGLTLVSLGLYQNIDYVAHAGFPLPFVVYYHYPGSGYLLGNWSKVTGQLNINPVNGAINTALYYLVLRLIYRRWQKANASPNGQSNILDS